MVPQFADTIVNICDNYYLGAATNFSGYFYGAACLGNRVVNRPVLYPPAFVGATVQLIQAGFQVFIREISAVYFLTASNVPISFAVAENHHVQVVDTFFVGGSGFGLCRYIQRHQVVGSEIQAHGDRSAFRQTLSGKILFLRVTTRKCQQHENCCRKGRYEISKLHSV